MRTIVVLDIDTTLANTDSRAMCLIASCLRCGAVMKTLKHHGRRNRYLCETCGHTEGKVPQSGWDNFLDADMMAQDPPEPDAQRAVVAMRKHGFEIHYITGRGERLRDVTEDWLFTHMGRDPAKETLIMRTEKHNNVAASPYKEWAIKKLIKDLDAEDANFLFFEDDEYVFKVYEKYGVVVRCPEGWRHFAPRPKYSSEPTWNL